MTISFQLLYRCQSGNTLETKIIVDLGCIVKRILLSLIILSYLLIRLDAQQEIIDTEVITVENIERIQELLIFGHGSIDQIALAPDGGQVATVTRLGMYIHDLSLPDSSPRLIANDHAPVINALFHPEWSWVAVSAPGILGLIDIESGELIRSFEGGYDGDPIHATANEMVLSANGNWLGITHGLDGGFSDVWDTMTGELLYSEYHRYSVGSPVFGPEDTSFAYVYYELGFPGTNAWYIVDTNDWDFTRALGNDTSFGAFATDFRALQLDESPFSSGNKHITGLRNGSVLLTTDSEGEHRIWNAESGELLQQLPDWIELWATHPDGRLLVLDSQDSSLSFLEPLTGETAPLSLTDEYTHYAFTNDGSLLGLVDEMGNIHVYELTSDEIIHTLPTDYFGLVNNVEFSADGLSIFFTENEVNTRHFDIVAGEITPVAHLPEGNGIMAFSAETARIALGTRNGTVELWDTESNDRLVVLDGHSDAITDLAFAADGLQLASVSTDQSIIIWDISTFTLLDQFSLPNANAESLSYNSDGSQLLILDADNSAGGILCDVNALEIIRSYPDIQGHYVASAFSSNSEFVVAGGSRVYLWDAIDPLNPDSAQSVDAVGSPFDIEINPRNDLFITTSSWVWYKRLNNFVTINDAESGEEIMKLLNFPDAIGSLAFSPDGRLLALGGWDGTIRLWGVPVSDE